MYATAPLSISFVKRFDRVRARDRIDRVRHAGFMRDDLLRAQRNQRRIFRRQRQRFIERIRMQRLASAEHRRERLDRHAHNIIFRLLRRERRARRLRVKSQQQRPRIACRKSFRHDARPQPPRRAILRDFFQQVAVRVEEKRKLRRKFIDVQAPRQSPPARTRSHSPA